MIYEVKTENELTNLLLSTFKARLSGIIGIDGTDNVGKTPLAVTMHQKLGGTRVSLDNFLQKNQGTYLRALNRTELSAAIRSTPRPIIAEGVCLLEVLESISTKTDLLIYVKKVRVLAGEVFWYEADKYEPEEEIESLICRLSPDPVKKEIVRYHWKYRPSQLADIIYLQTNK